MSSERESKTEAEAKTEADTETETGSEAEAETGSEAEAETGSEAETKSESEADAPRLTRSVEQKRGDEHPAFRWHKHAYLTGRGNPSWKEVLVVVVLGLAILLPGLGNYTLIDPWETHYAEVARRMLQDDDFVHTKWQNEGFRSKPVLTFWMIAAGMQSMGIGDDGGYSGEMVSSPSVMFAVRYPFALFGVLGLVLMWWMLATLVSRRVAWLAYLVTVCTPFYFFIARQAITDMPMVACLMGSIACFAMALEAGEDELEPMFGPINAYHVFMAIIGLFIGWQLIYYAIYFTKYPHLARGMNMPQPQLVIPLFMAALSAIFVFWHRIWRPKQWQTPGLAELGAGLNFIFSRVTTVSVGLTGLAVFVLTSSSRVQFRLGMGGVVAVRAVALVAAAGLAGYLYFARKQRQPMWSWWYEPARKRRQVYMYWFYALVGISVLGKGLPGLGLAGVTCLLYVVLTNSWGRLRELEIPRGIVLVVLVVVPWHVAMLLKDGSVFIRDYIIGHNFKRATSGMHGERGTFNFFISQIGIGFWPWVALLPAAAASFLSDLSPKTREGRVRLIIGIWAISSVALFSAVQTKFHHYVFPALPALAAIVAFWFDDLLRERARYTWLLAIMSVLLCALVLRDLLGEQKQFIELFIYRYDRPWPKNVDITDTLFVFGLMFLGLFVLLVSRKLRPYFVAGVMATGLAFAYWGMHGYMGAAAPHWGMRNTVRDYYEQRQIYGIDIRYWGTRELADEWAGVKDEYMVRSFIPDEFAAGLPMKVNIAIVDYRHKVQRRVVLKGYVSRFASDRFWIKLPQTELKKLDPLIDEGRVRPRARIRPWRQVNADRLIAWQLYWRGENFWSGDEIWAKSPDTRTAFKQLDNKAFLKYLRDPKRAGRRFYVVTESGRAPGLRNLLPTQHAKDTFRILNTSSNKFTLLTFTL